MNLHRACLTRPGSGLARPLLCLGWLAWPFPAARVGLPDQSGLFPAARVGLPDQSGL